jgi:hypothetical protein
MPANAINAIRLGVLLHAEGMMPKECTNLELLTPDGGVLQLRYTVNVAAEDLPKLARAIAKLAEEEQQ